MYCKWRITENSCLILEHDKVFYCHRLSLGVNHYQKVLKSVLMISLPLRPQSACIIFTGDPDYYYFLITAIKNTKGKFSLELLNGGNCSLGGMRGGDAYCSVFCCSSPVPRWAALWASALCKMVLVYWNAHRCFIFFSEIFLPIGECYCENEMPSCGQFSISQTWACFSEKVVQLSLQLGAAK